MIRLRETDKDEAELVCQSCYDDHPSWVGELFNHKHGTCIRMFMLCDGCMADLSDNYTAQMGITQT